MFKRKGGARHLPKSVLLEETGSPAITRLAILLTAVVLGSFIYWATETELTEVAVSQGEIVPFGETRKVQHWRGGVITKISVKDGELVRKGKVLLKINSLVSRGQIEIYEEMKVRAPVTGWVHQLKYNTAGEVLVPGVTIMELVPRGAKLVAEIRIHPRDIGHVKPGDKVVLKFTAYDFARYGGLEGQLFKISASTYQDPKGASFYRGIVMLKKTHVSDDPTLNPVMPGMTLLADIKTGKKTIIEYLLKPVFTSAKSAMRER